MSTIYLNISERYGDKVEVTLNDYRELNPSGEFFQTDDSIFEVVKGQSVQIAEGQPSEGWSLETMQLSDDPNRYL